MTSDEFQATLRRWLQRHPLRSPPDDTRFAQDVMARIDAQPAARPWRAPGWFAGLAAAAACAAVLAIVSRPPTALQLAQQVESQWEALLEVDELDVPTADLEEELRAADTMLVAQAVEDADEAWIDELELLEDVESSMPPSIEPSDDQWLEEFNEMEWLDQQAVERTRQSVASMQHASWPLTWPARSLSVDTCMSVVDGMVHA